MSYKRGLLFVLASLCTASMMAQTSASSKPIALDTRARDYEAGVCMYSFRKYTAFEAIEKARDVGAPVVEFFLWQKLSPQNPDVTLNQNLADEHIAALLAKLKECKVTAVNAYVSNFGKSEDEMRKLFEFAKKLGLRGLTGEPPVERLDAIEKFVKEFNIQLCFHNHAKNEQRPNYRNWDPEYLMGLMKDRSPLMGFSVDTGHIYRSDMDPVEYLKKLEGRVISVHLKDVKERKSGSPDLVFGKGVGDIPAILKELKRQGFSGHIGIEFDTAGEQVEQDVKECLEFIKKHR